jgi:predicted flap endonuclease-1-like 5' DNA nuclease
MITWATEYWYLCLIALIIGVATGWWIWARYSAARDDALLEDDTVTRIPAPAPPAPKLEPAKPTIDVAEPVAFTAPVAAAPVAAAPSGNRPTIAAAVGAPDDLELIKGVGPKLNALLISLGVTRFDQIAAWTTADIEEVDRFLGNFSGRIVRDGWVEQAGYLATGNTAAFTAKYGEIGSEKK